MEEDLFLKQTMLCNHHGLSGVAGEASPAPAKPVII